MGDAIRVPGFGLLGVVFCCTPPVGSDGCDQRLIQETQFNVCVETNCKSVRQMLTWLEQKKAHTRTLQLGSESTCSHLCGNHASSGACADADHCRLDAGKCAGSSHHHRPGEPGRAPPVFQSQVGPSGAPRPLVLLHTETPSKCAWKS